MPLAACLPARSDGMSGKIPRKALVPGRMQWGILQDVMEVDNKMPGKRFRKAGIQGRSR